MRTKPLFRMLAPLLALTLLAAAILPASAAPGSTTRISVDSNGTQGNGESYYAAISADGCFVAFASYADNLVTGDNNYKADVFVHDRQIGKTTRVSVSSDGEEGNGDSDDPAISGDGRFVAFVSHASNLVTGDTNGKYDIFVHNRHTGKTTRVSVSSNGEEGNDDSFEPAISADGRFVAFKSHASNLVEGLSRAENHIFVYDRQTGKTSLISVDSNGVEGDCGSSLPAISADGRYVAFTSEATNLVAGDTNKYHDVFVHDRQLGETTRVSVDSSGAQGVKNSDSPAISADGLFVAFRSCAANLVAGDINGVCDIFVHDRQTGKTTRVSLSSSGAEGDGVSYEPNISADGRFVAFYSDAANLAAGDTNGVCDIFVHDRQSGVTTRVSVSSSSAEANGASYEPTISADGHFVAFYSDAANLVAGDTNGFFDIFVHENSALATYLPLLIR